MVKLKMNIGFGVRSVLNTGPMRTQVHALVMGCSVLEHDEIAKRRVAQVRVKSSQG